MGNLQQICRIGCSTGYSNLKKIIFLNVCLFCLFSSSFTIIAAPQPSVSLPSGLSKLQQVKHSSESGSISESAATVKSTLGKLLQKFNHDKNAKRVRRNNSWNSSETYFGASFHTTGNHLQDNFFTNFDDGLSEEELKRKRLYLLLAQQEAKCLVEFGELETAISNELPQDLFQPVVCLAGSENHAACEQCMEILPGVHEGFTISKSVSCQSICNKSSALPNCAERCGNVVRSLTNGMERVTNGAVDGNIERNVKSRCNQKDCSLKIPSSEVNTNSLTTNVFCEGVTQPLLYKAPTTSSSILITTSRIQQKESNYRHFVYLKSLFSNRDTGVEAEAKVPIIFVVEEREFLSNRIGSIRDVEGNWTSWRVLGKSPYGLDKIQVAYQQQTYQWRVTAIGVHGPLAVSVVKSFQTLDGYVEPGPPRRVFVMENKTKESTVDVLLGWDPPEERACFYKIVLETRNAEEVARTVRIKGEPLGVHKVWFRDLKFDSTYEVRITSRSADWDEDESTHASLSFATPACLHAHQFRFDKCAPPPPRNLYTVKVTRSSKVLDVLGSPSTSLKRKFSSQLVWEPPAHASIENPIEKYVVDIRAFSWNLRHSSKIQSKNTDGGSKLIDPKDLFLPRQINLPGNVTHLTIDNLDGNAEYTVLISAVTSKGASPPATLTIKFREEIGVLDTNLGFWVYPCGVLVAVLLVASGFHATKTISTRRQIKAARDSYFKSIDQQDAYVADWSVVSLTEDPNNTWKMLEENSFPKAKWHVGFQDLKIGDIIGQGAFGIVRKAKIRSDKYLELLKRHNRKTLDTHYQICSSQLRNNDETAMETVALKMLRVAATKADREDLMKELMTMQSLGMHPQIVTLLGVCDTPKSMFLVLEYCPGGDLLSFLRKFREKYLPLLNMECGSTKESWCEDLEFQRLAYETKLMKETCGIQVDSEQVCYADLHHNELSSPSQELSDDAEGVGKPEAETDDTPSSCDETEECGPISEKDVLSYARQIALGMAYLERNHIIHRDLACRNVLVMGDHKRVKISDFGLSRDIYTWNVYEQKTAGKMPFKWMALESITSRVFTSKSDVWSYGIVLWELVTLGAVPYPALENQELFKILRSGYRMERPDNCSEELYALMRKCWRTAPVDRPNFTELISYLETMMDTEPELYLMLQP